MKVNSEIIAIFISIISLILSLSNQRKQNRRWEKFNEGKPEITEIKFRPEKEWNLDKVHSIDWGYKPDLYIKVGSPNTVFAPYVLKIRNEQNEIIPNINDIFTYDDAKNELEKIKYDGNAKICKRYKTIFTIQNAGKTEITGLSINIDCKLEKGWQKVFSSNTEINLNASQKTNISFDLYIKPNYLPEELKFKISFNYKDFNGKSLNRKIGAKWTSKDNYWSYTKI